MVYFVGGGWGRPWEGFRGAVTVLLFLQICPCTFKMPLRLRLVGQGHCPGSLVPLKRRRVILVRRGSSARMCPWANSDQHWSQGRSLGGLTNVTGGKQGPERPALVREKATGRDTAPCLRLPLQILWRWRLWLPPPQMVHH